MSGSTEDPVSAGVEARPERVADPIDVATSRAQCRVELVCSPRLLEADCKTVEQMTLVNALCRFVELA